MPIQLTKRTVIAAFLALAAIALIVAVSLRGTSGLFGTGLAQTTAPQTQASQTPVSTAQAPLNPVGGQRDGPPVTPKPGGPLTPSATTYKVDAIEFFLTPDQFVEYKFRLNTGQRMIFNWKATGPVEVDFHTVPDGKPISASETYQRGQATSGSGDYRSPYPGLHGWFWENRGTNPVLIQLKTAGFYTGALMISDGEQIPMELQDPPAPKEP